MSLYKNYPGKLQILIEEKLNKRVAKLQNEIELIFTIHQNV